MMLRPSLAAIATSLLLAACGGSSHSSTTAATATAAASSQTTIAVATPDATATAAPGGATTTTSSTSAPPEVPTTKKKTHHGSTHATSQGAHVLTTITVNASGDISPPVISVPSGVEVDIHVTNHDSSVVTVSVAATRHSSARLDPGASGKLRAGDLRDGTHRILVNGTPRGQILAGAQGGP